MRLMISAHKSIWAGHYSNQLLLENTRTCVLHWVIVNCSLSEWVSSVHSLSLSLFLSVFLVLFLSLSLCVCLSLSINQSLSLSLPLPPFLPPSLPLSLSLSLSLPLSLPPSRWSWLLLQNFYSYLSCADIDKIKKCIEKMSGGDSVKSAPFSLTSIPRISTLKPQPLTKLLTVKKSVTLFSSLLARSESSEVSFCISEHAHAVTL